MTMTISPKWIFREEPEIPYSRKGSPAPGRPGSRNRCQNPLGPARTAPEVTGMINNEELPIGFTMELAMHSDTLNRFAKLPKQEQQIIVEGARNVKSRDEMRNYAESIFKP